MLVLFKGRGNHGKSSNKRCLNGGVIEVLLPYTLAFPINTSAGMKYQRTDREKAQFCV